MLEIGTFRLSKFESLNEKSEIFYEANILFWVGGLNSFKLINTFSGCF